MKKMSKIVATFIAVSLLQVTPVWAKSSDQQPENKRQVQTISVNKIPEEMLEALEKVYVILPELKGLRVTSAEVTEEEENEPSLWYFTLQEKKGSKDSIHARVAIESESGKLVNYFMYNTKWGAKKPVSPDRARKIADKFLRNALGDEADLYQFSRVSDISSEDEDDYEEKDQRTVYYNIVVNKVPVAGDSIRIIIDGQGHVVRFSNSMEKIPELSSFPDPKDAIKQKDAEKTYLDAMDMQLRYQLFPMKGDKGDPKPVLKYVPSFRGGIDAMTGEKDENPFDYKGEDDEEKETLPQELITLSPQGTQPVIKAAEEAKKLLEEMAQADLSNAEFHEYTSDGIRSYNWELYDRKTDYEMEASVDVDEKTGKVKRVDYEVYSEEEESDEDALDLKQAKDEAVKLLEKWLPSDMEQVFLQYARSFYQGNTFVFLPTYQDVPVEGIAYRVALDGHGKPTYLNITYGIDFSMLPDNKDTVSAKDAAKAYMKANELELFYVMNSIYDRETDEETLLDPKLYYLLKNQSSGDYIDAFTGKLVKRR
ncbi:MAG: YcdB/YcdC domain-containing protein [Clostridia bacterium]